MEGIRFQHMVPKSNVSSSQMRLSHCSAQTEGGSQFIQLHQIKTSFHISITADFHQSDQNPKDKSKHFHVFCTLIALYNPYCNFAIPPLPPKPQNQLF